MDAGLRIDGSSNETGETGKGETRREVEGQNGVGACVDLLETPRKTVNRIERTDRKVSFIIPQHDFA